MQQPTFQNGFNQNTKLDFNETLIKYEAFDKLLIKYILVLINDSADKWTLY